jgi:hypothetical protein
MAAVQGMLAGNAIDMIADGDDGEPLAGGDNNVEEMEDK